MKVGDLVRWIDNGWLAIVLSVDGWEGELIKCLLAHDSTTCVFVKNELEVVSCR